MPVPTVVQEFATRIDVATSAVAARLSSAEVQAALVEAQTIEQVNTILGPSVAALEVMATPPQVPPATPIPTEIPV